MIATASVFLCPNDTDRPKRIAVDTRDNNPTVTLYSHERHVFPSLTFHCPTAGSAVELGDLFALITGAALEHMEDEEPDNAA